MTKTLTLTSSLTLTSIQSCIAAAKFVDEAAKKTQCRRKRALLDSNNAEDTQFAIVPTETQTYKLFLERYHFFNDWILIILEWCQRIFRRWMWSEKVVGPTNRFIRTSSRRLKTSEIFQNQRHGWEICQWSLDLLIHSHLQQLPHTHLKRKLSLKQWSSVPMLRFSVSQLAGLFAKFHYWIWYTYYLLLFVSNFSFLWYFWFGLLFGV